MKQVQGILLTDSNSVITREMLEDAVKNSRDFRCRPPVLLPLISGTLTEVAEKGTHKGRFFGLETRHR